MHSRCALLTIVALSLTACASTPDAEERYARPPTPAPVTALVGKWRIHSAIHQPGSEADITYEDGVLEVYGNTATYTGNVLKFSEPWREQEVLNGATVRKRDECQFTFYPPDWMKGVRYVHHEFFDGSQVGTGDLPAGTDTVDEEWERVDKIDAAAARLALSDELVGRWEGQIWNEVYGPWKEWFTIRLEDGVYTVNGIPAERDEDELEFDLRMGSRSNEYELRLVAPDKLGGWLDRSSDGARLQVSIRRVSK